MIWCRSDGRPWETYRRFFIQALFFFALADRWSDVVGRRRTYSDVVRRTWPCLALLASATKKARYARRVRKELITPDRFAGSRSGRFVCTKPRTMNCELGVRLAQLRNFLLTRCYKATTFGIFRKCSVLWRCFVCLMQNLTAVFQLLRGLSIAFQILVSRPTVGPKAKCMQETCRYIM